jgi:hypothetical protein
MARVAYQHTVDECASKIRALEATLADIQANQSREMLRTGSADSVTQVRARFYFPGSANRKLFGGSGELPAMAATYSIGTVLVERLMPRLSETSVKSPLYQELINQLNHLVAQAVRGQAEMPLPTLDDTFTVQVSFPGPQGRVIAYPEAKLAPYLIACEFVGAHRILPVNIRLLPVLSQSQEDLYPKIADYSSAFGTYVPEISIAFGRYLQQSSQLSVKESALMARDNVLGEFDEEVLPKFPPQAPTKTTTVCANCNKVHITSRPCEAGRRPPAPYKEALLTPSGLPRPPTPGKDIVLPTKCKTEVNTDVIREADELMDQDDPNQANDPAEIDDNTVDELLKP